MKPTASTAIGVDIGQFSVKIATVVFRKNKACVEKLIEVESPWKDGGNVDIEGVKKVVCETVGEFKDPLIVSNLRGRDIIVRNMLLSVKKKKDLEATLPFQIEPLIPYQIEEAVFDKVISSKTKEGIRVTILSTHDKSISNHITNLGSLGLEPEVISCSPIALGEISKTLFPKSPPPLLLHFGAQTTLCLRFDKGKLFAARAVNIGFNSFVNALARDEKISVEQAERRMMEEINLADISPEKHSSVNATKERLARDLERSLYSVKHHEDKGRFKEAFVTGGFLLAKGAGEFIEHVLRIKILSPPKKNPLMIRPDEIQKYAVAIGAALGCLPNSLDTVDFRKKEFAYKNPWRRLKKPIINYLTISCALAFVLFLLGGFLLHQKEIRIKEQVAQILYSTKKDGQKVSLKDIRLNELQEMVVNFEKEQAKFKSPISLYPNVYLVSDFLNWLGAKTKGFVGGDGLSKIQLENFSYQLVSRPTEKDSKKRYEVAIDLEVMINDSATASKFKEIITNAKNMIVVNTIKWDVAQNRYKASFNLKSKPKPPIKELEKQPVS